MKEDLPSRQVSRRHSILSSYDDSDLNFAVKLCVTRNGAGFRVTVLIRIDPKYL